MKQTANAYIGFKLVTNRSLKREFLDEMNPFVYRTEFTGLVQPFALEIKTGRPPFLIATMLRIHFMQQFFGLLNTCHRQYQVDRPGLAAQSRYCCQLARHHTIRIFFVER